MKKYDKNINKGCYILISNIKITIEKEKIMKEFQSIVNKVTQSLIINQVLFLKNKFFIGSAFGQDRMESL